MSDAPHGRLGLPYEKLEQYKQLVLRWNRRISLVSRRSPKESIQRLISHSLQAEGILPPGVRTLFDVGSGAGLPGIPIALARPVLGVRVVERSTKKQLFLRKVIRELEVENVDLADASFAPEMVQGERPLAITALGLGGYRELAESVQACLEPGDGLLLFIGKQLSEEIAEIMGNRTFRWRLLEGSERAGVVWIEIP